MADLGVRLRYLMSLVQCSMSIDLDQHKVFYQTVEDYFSEGHNRDKPDEEVFSTMVKLNTIVEIHVFPDTPVGSYLVCHYNLEDAVERMIEVIEYERR